MDKMNEMKMKDCLNCAVGQEAIRRYCSIAHYTYEEIVNNEENLSDLKQLMSIMGIYDCFRKEETWEVPFYWLKKWVAPWAETDIKSKRIHGKLQKDYAKKREFSEKIAEEENKMEEIGFCHIYLQKIIRACKNFYMIERGNLQEELCEDYGHLKMILEEMHRINGQRGLVDVENEMDFETALRHLNTRNKKQEDISLKDREKDGDIYEKVFDNFCYYEPKTLQCKCAGEFMRLVEARSLQSQISESEKFAERMERLKPMAKEIMVEYLKNANKKFGVNLRLIMEQKDIKEQFLSQITGMKISSIQHLQKNETVAPSKDIVNKLSRALLVSEDVLYKGIGKEYGNWKALTDEESLQSIQEQEGLQRRETINMVYAGIREINSFDEPLFLETLKKIFTDEFPKDIEIAEMICDGGEEIMENTIKERAWNAFRYECLAYQKDANTLLEILEKHS